MLIVEQLRIKLKIVQQNLVEKLSVDIRKLMLFDVVIAVVIVEAVDKVVVVMLVIIEIAGKSADC